jgi:hypothetical protein
MSRWVSQVSQAVLLAGVLTGAAAPLAPAALAHGSGQVIPDAAYYRADLLAVSPSPPGVQVRLDPAGEWIELANTGPAEVVVLGYTREPYLRVTATTVQENQLSQTTYLNRSLFADSVPSGQDASSVAPAWKDIGGNGAVRWHDHRIHWMGQGRPPVVAADPRHPHPVGDWTVHATAGGQAFEIRGELRWTGKPDAADGRPAVPQWLLWVVESMAVLIVVLVGLVVRQRRRTRALLAGPTASAAVGPGPAASAAVGPGSGSVTPTPARVPPPRS